MKGWALAYFHITPAEFGELYLPEFWSAMGAFSEQTDADRRHIGELVRGATLRLWNLQVSPRNRISEPAKFWTMPWDEGGRSTEDISKAISQLSDEDRDAMARKFLHEIGQDDGR